MSNNNSKTIVSNLETKSLTRRDFLKMVVTFLTFFSLGGLTKYFTNQKDNNQLQQNLQNKGFGNGGYGM
jgi:hypothetical protein